MKTRWLERVAMNNPIRTWVMRRFESPRVLGGLNLPAGAACLDLGCGQGIDALLISQAYDCSRIVAVDIDPAMIARARKVLARPPRWARSIRRDNIELLCADATNLDLPDATFDSAFIFPALHHIEKWRSVLGECFRVLKGGGVLSMEDAMTVKPHPMLDRYFGHLSFGEAEFLAALKEIGFEIASFETAFSGQWCFCRAMKPVSPCQR